MTDQPDPDAILIAKLLGAKARAADPRNLIDVSDLTSEQFAELLRQGGYAVTADDVRRRFGDQRLTSADVLDALKTAGPAPAMEVDANTSDAELDAFLFGPD
jgi:hypothetical protein